MKRKQETPEQTFERWKKDPKRVYRDRESLEFLGYEPGQVSYIECFGMRYDRWPIPGTDTYVVVEWCPEEGTIGAMEVACIE